MSNNNNNNQPPPTPFNKHVARMACGRRRRGIFLNSNKNIQCNTKPGGWVWGGSVRKSKLFQKKLRPKTSFFKSLV